MHKVSLLKNQIFYFPIEPERIYNPIMAMGLRQWLPFSCTTLRGKHCQIPIAIMGVVDAFGLRQIIMFQTALNFGDQQLIS